MDLVEETKNNRAESQQIKSNAGFWRREKPECSGKKLSQQIRELTNSVRIWRRVRKSKTAYWLHASLVTTAPTLLSIFKTSKLLFSGSPQHPNQLDSPFPFDSYLKKEPLVGLTKHATDTSFEETNGLGTRKGGIINEQRLRDLPQIGQVSGKLEKNIFQWEVQCCMQRMTSPSMINMFKLYCRPSWDTLVTNMRGSLVTATATSGVIEIWVTYPCVTFGASYEWQL